MFNLLRETQRALVAFIVLLSMVRPVHAQAPTVTGVTTPLACSSHSTQCVYWTSSASSGHHRIRYGLTSAYNTGCGVGGTVGCVLEILANNGNNTCGPGTCSLTLSGLAASITYHFSVEDSLDGTTWTAAADHTFTTQALPAVHPAIPDVSNASYLPAQPVTTGYNDVTVNSSNCQDPTTGLQALINAASGAAQIANGTIIRIPQADKCDMPQIPDDLQLMAVPATNVNTTTGFFTKTSIHSSWTLANNQAVRMMGGPLPGSSTQGSDGLPYPSGFGGPIYNGPFHFGVTYYTVNVSGDNFQLSATLGGSPIIPGDTGANTILFQQWPPQHSHWIIIRTAEPDATFCSAGTRCVAYDHVTGAPIWAPKMPKLRRQAYCYNCTGPTFGYGAHHIWFMGINAGFEESTITKVNALTVDPPPSYNLFNADYGRGNNFITWDRMYFVCGGRCHLLFPEVGGSYMAWLDSEFPDVEYYHLSPTPTLSVNPPHYGFKASQSGSTTTIEAGQVVMGTSDMGIYNVCHTPNPLTWTVTGGTSNAGIAIYWKPDCTPLAVGAPGTTMTCTGSLLDKNNTNHPCSSTTQTTVDWARDDFGVVNLNGTTVTYVSGQDFSILSLPGVTNGIQAITLAGVGQSRVFTGLTNTQYTSLDNYGVVNGVHWGYNGINCYTVAVINLSSGVPTGVTQSWGPQGLTQWLTEGATAGLSGNGPGPMTFQNIYWGGAPNINWMWDDGAQGDTVGIRIHRNTVNMPLSRRMGSPTSNGLRYFSRNWFEGKHSQQVSIVGNTIFGQFGDVSTTGPGGLFHNALNNGNGPQLSYHTSDIEVAFNTWVMGNACFQGGGGVMGMYTLNPSQRFRLHDNFCIKGNGWDAYDGNAVNWPNGGTNGQAFELDGAMEDPIFNHLTIFDNRGNSPTLMHGQVGPIEGMQITNNFWWFGGNASGIDPEQNAGTSYTPNISGVGKALIDSYFTSPPGNPNATIHHNVAVPYYTNGHTGTGAIVDKDLICSTMGGTTVTGADACGGTGYFSTVNFGHVINQGSGAANLAYIKYVNPNGDPTNILNFALRYDSPYINSASDGKAIGADVVATLRAQGKMGQVNVTNVTATTAKISIWAYDETTALTFDIAVAPSDPTTQASGFRCQGTAGQHMQTVTFGTCSAALAAHTKYRGRVNGVVEAPEFSFSTP